MIYELTRLINIIECLAVEMICIVVLVGANLTVHRLHEQRKVISLVIAVLKMVIFANTVILSEHVLI